KNVELGTSNEKFPKTSKLDISCSIFEVDSDREASQALISRARGMSLIRLAESGKINQRSRSDLTEKALQQMNEAGKNFPDDGPTLQGRGYALWLQNRKEEAGASFHRALKLAPENETTLIYAASLATEMGQLEQALELWRHAVEINPWTARSHFELAR